MVHLLILDQGRNFPGVERLCRWAEFFRLEYTIFNSGLLDLETEDDSLVIVITPDLVPEAALLANIFTKKEYEATSRISFHLVEGKWCLSMCMVTKWANLRNHVKNLSLENIEKLSLSMDPKIASSETEDLLIKTACKACTPQQRLDTLWLMINQYWYKLSEVLVRRFIIHLWIHQYQNVVLSKENHFDDTNLTWVRSQSVFSGAFKRQDLGLISLDDLHVYMKKSPTLEECYKGEIQGYSAQVLLSKNRIARHPLSLNGKLILLPHEEKIEVDTSITVVGFYYDLGYNEKPREDYMRSIEDYAQIRHPLLFFGSPETCRFVNEARKGLEEYTLTVVKDLPTWELVRLYQNDFDCHDEELDFKERRRYSILTCLKSWAMKEAVERHPFLSKYYAWVDPGLYRHNHLAPSNMVGIPLLSNAKVPEKKILFPGMCSSPGTTEEEFDSSVENVIANILLGTKESWLNFHEKFSELCLSRFSQEKFCTEQVLVSRLAGICPELFEFKLMGFDQSQLLQFLGLKAWDLKE